MRRNIYLLLFTLCAILRLDSQVYVAQDVYIASGTEVYVKDTIIIASDNIKIEGILTSSIVHSNSKIHKSSPCPVLENTEANYYAEVSEEDSKSIEDKESKLSKKEVKSKKLIDNPQDTPVLTEANPAMSIPFPMGENNEKFLSEREGLFIEHKKWSKECSLVPLEINFIYSFKELSSEQYILYELNDNSYKLISEESKRGPPSFKVIKS